MYQTRQASLYEVKGKTRDDGRIYETHLCLNCGGYVVYLPTAMCSKCGYLTRAQVIKVPETFATEAREAIHKLAEIHAPIVAEHRASVTTS